MNRSYILALCLFPCPSLCMMNPFKKRSTQGKPVRLELQETPFDEQPLLASDPEYKAEKEYLDKARQHNPADYLKMDAGCNQPYHLLHPRRSRTYIDFLLISLTIPFRSCFPKSEPEEDEERFGSL